MRKKYTMTFFCEADKLNENVDYIKSIVSVGQVKEIKKVRSSSQNSALHLWFTQYADELNEAGFSVRKTMREDFEIPWTDVLFKELVWRPLQVFLFDIATSKKIDTEKLNKMIDVIVNTIGKRTGVAPPFPSLDGMIEEYEKEQKIASPRN